MTMLFFSPDNAEVQGAANHLLEAGIPCEIRNGPFPEGTVTHPFDAELWIENDQDHYRALMICVALGVGFAKRAMRRVALADAD